MPVTQAGRVAVGYAQVRQAVTQQQLRRVVQRRARLVVVPNLLPTRLDGGRQFVPAQRISSRYLLYSNDTSAAFDPARASNEF